MTVATGIKVSLFEALRGTMADKATMYVAGVGGIGGWAAWRLWLKDAGSFAGDVMPIASLALIVLTIFLKLWPRSEPGAEEKDSTASKITKAAAKVGKFAGLGALIVAAFAFGMLLFRSDAKAAPAQQPPAIAGKRKTTDDAGDDGDADEEDDGTGTPWYRLARPMIGTEEQLPNGKANPKVNAMFEAVTTLSTPYDCRKTPWCAIFMNWLFKRLNIPGTNSAMARSFGDSRNFVRIDKPFIGCVVVLWRPASKERPYDDGSTGHVGMYAGETATHVLILGGNQGDAISIAKFPKNRLTSKHGDCGYFMPRGKWKSRTNKAAAAGAAAGTIGTAAAGTALVSEEAPKADPVTVAEQIKAPLEQIQAPIESIGTPMAGKIAMCIGLACCVISLGVFVYVMFIRNDDAHNGH